MWDSYSLRKEYLSASWVMSQFRRDQHYCTVLRSSDALHPGLLAPTRFGLFASVVTDKHIVLVGDVGLECSSCTVQCTAFFALAHVVPWRCDLWSRILHVSAFRLEAQVRVQAMEHGESLKPPLVVPPLVVLPSRSGAASVGLKESSL